MNEFRLYPELKRDLELVNQELRLIEFRKRSLGDAPIARYSDEPFVPGKSKEKILLDLINEEFELERRRQDLQGRINNVFYIMACLDKNVTEIAKDKYIHQMSWDELTAKYKLSRSGLDNQIRRNLERLS